MPNLLFYALLAIFGLVPLAAIAQNISAQLLKARVYKAIDRQVPAAREIINAQLNVPSAPVIAIGYFETKGADDVADWGGALGWFLMEGANGAWRDLAVVPSYQYNFDAATGNHSDADDRRGTLIRVAKRTGASVGLTGFIKVESGNFDVQFEMLEFPGGRTKAVRRLNGAIADLPESIATLAQEMFTLAAPNDIGQTRNIVTPTLAEVEVLANTLTRTRIFQGSKRVKFYETLWRENRQSSALAGAYLVALGAHEKSGKVREALPAITAAAPSFGTVEVYGQLQRSQYSRTGVDADALQRLANVLAANPNNISAWLALSNAYIGEQVMYQEDSRGMRSVISPAIDHHLGYANGVAIALEAVQRWPNHYRTWWSLSYALEAYAGLVRGTAYWKNVPDESRQRYTAIMSIAEECLGKAIKLHPQNGQLFAMMIQFDKHAGRDWMSSFRKSAALQPHDYTLYQTAFNYARPQWGGTRDQMREIYQLAVENNPDESWPTTLRDAWASEIKPLIDFKNRWVRIIAAVGLGVMLLLVWQRWRSNRIGRY
jgi:tetratricopeptide (TPR) repeat protein